LLILYEILSSVLNSELYNNYEFLKALQLSRSVKFYLLKRRISEFLDINFELKPIELILKIQNNKDEILNGVSAEIINQLTNNSFEYPRDISNLV